MESIAGVPRWVSDSKGASLRLPRLDLKGKLEHQSIYGRFTDDAFDYHQNYCKF